MSFDGRPGSDSAQRGKGTHDDEGVLRSVPYRVEETRDVRKRLIEERKRTLGNDYPDRIPGAEDFLPLPGAKRLVVTFTAPSVKWRFSSDVYSGDQEDRVRQLLLVDSALCVVLRRIEDKRFIDGAAYRQVNEGDSVRQVLKHLGAPYLSRPLGQTGFALRYDLQEADRNRRVELHFDQTQKLVKKTFVE